MDLFRTRRLVGGNDYPYIDLLSFLVGDDLRDNRLLFLDKAIRSWNEKKREEYVAATHTSS